MKQGRPGRPTGQEARDEAMRLLNIGANLLEQGQVDDALHFLKQAYELEPDSVAIRLNLGGAYVLAGRHKRAIPLLESARDAEPNNSMVWINLAAAYLGNPILSTEEQQNKAIAAFDRALELNPAAPSVHYNLGLIFLNRGDRDLAIEVFRRAVQVNPFDRDAYLWLRKLGAADEGVDEPGGRGDDSE